MQMFQCEKQFRAVEACPLLVESMLALQMMEQFASIDEAVVKLSGYVARYCMEQTYARTRYNFCSDWKLNLSGTTNGLSTCARTKRSARVCVISFRETICAFRIVFRA